MAYQDNDLEDDNKVLEYFRTLTQAKIVQNENDVTYLQNTILKSTMQAYLEIKQQDLTHQKNMIKTVTIAAGLVGVAVLLSYAMPYMIAGLGAAGSSTIKCANGVLKDGECVTDATAALEEWNKKLYTCVVDGQQVESRNQCNMEFRPADLTELIETYYQTNMEQKGIILSDYIGKTLNANFRI